MVNMEIKGGCKTQRALISTVANWVAHEVLGPRLARNVNINYVITRNLDADGWCVWEDDNIRPREFTVEVRKELSYPELILTICHEMVHIRQMARSELKEVGIWLGGKRHCQVWKGKKINSEMEYKNRPWEKEAYRLQESLGRKFVKETNFDYTSAMQRRDYKHSFSFSTKLQAKISNSNLEIVEKKTNDK